MSVWMGLIAAALGAGVPGEAGYEPEAISADPFRPPLDPGALLATELPEVTERLVARADMWQAHNLLIWTDADTGEQRDVIGDTLTVHLGAARGNGRWRLGVGVPLHLLLSSDAFDAPAFVAGDLAVSGKLRPRQGPAALTLGLSIPLEGVSHQLGAQTPALDVGAVVGRQGERLALGANAGLRLQDPVTIDNANGSFELGSQAWYRLGGGYTVAGDWDLTAELMGAVAADSVSGQPLELLVGTRSEADGRLVRAGLGVGLRAGIGAPTWRLLVGIGRDPGPLPTVDAIALPGDLLDDAAR
ncbi:MAG: hypothetical protein ACI8S6_005231 [Myxococcota bacterium]|jgi:hypothetical protein